MNGYFMAGLTYSLKYRSVIKLDTIKQIMKAIENKLLSKAEKGLEPSEAQSRGSLLLVQK